MGQSLGKHHPKTNFVVELDLIFMPKEAEKWKNDIKSLLRQIDNNIIKERQISIGEKIENKWIGICEAQFDGHIDVEKSIPKHCLPDTEFPGMIIMIGEQHMKERNGFAIKTSYPDERIQYITIAGFPGDTYRATRAIIALIEDDFINADRNKYNERIGIEGKEAGVEGSYNRTACGSNFVEDFTKSTDARHEKREKSFSTDKTMDDCHSVERDEVKQSLLKFLNSILNQKFSQTHSKILSSSLFPQIKRTSNTSKKQSRIGQQEHEFSFTFGEESIRWVVYDVQSGTKLITVHKDENFDETAHIIMEKDGIDENCVVNSLALRNIRRFIQESALDEINVITHTLDDGTRALLWSFLDSKLERVKVIFLEPGDIPKRPWILLCPEKHDQADETFKEPKLPTGLKYMITTIHGEWDSPGEVKIRNSQTDTPTIHLLFRDSMIDEGYYLNRHAKDEIYTLLKKSETVANIAGEVEKKGTKDNSIVAVPKAEVPSPSCKRRVYIKYLSNLPIAGKAFSDFTDKYIKRIEPIWVGEEPVEKGSLCIVVCFTLARLLDDISAVIKITQQDCISMLVVIQNCREGISPGPMLNHNPDSCFTDYSNILYGDGECYECDINSEAKAKIQSFINRN